MSAKRMLLPVYETPELVSQNQYNYGSCHTVNSDGIRQFWGPLKTHIISKCPLKIITISICLQKKSKKSKETIPENSSIRGEPLHKTW
jgi:hypothetical protein